MADTRRFLRRTHSQSYAHVTYLYIGRNEDSERMSETMELLWVSELFRYECL